MNLLRILILTLLVAPAPVALAAAGHSSHEVSVAFPPSLDSYGDADIEGIGAILMHRAQVEPLNVAVSLIFVLAIIHTFAATRFAAIGHHLEEEHESAVREGRKPRLTVPLRAQFYHFIGEVEAVFGLWVIALVGAITAFHGWQTAVDYVSYGVNYTEPIFVVVIMTMASTRPVLRFAEDVMRRLATLLGGTLVAWWFTVLTVGPLLGSFITEPAAMTICAVLLGRKIYELEPSTAFKYATLGLLFVNVSVGGTLTHFAAPPVLMVADAWGWTTPFMFLHFGATAASGIIASNLLYWFAYRGEFARLQEVFARRNLKDEVQRRFIRRYRLEEEFRRHGPEVTAEVGLQERLREMTEEASRRIKERLAGGYRSLAEEKGLDPAIVEAAFEERYTEVLRSRIKALFPGLLPEEERGELFDPDWDRRDDPVPLWITIVQLALMGWTIINSHHPPLFIPGFLFSLAFADATEPFQNRISLRPAVLVGFFLAGLVIHGGLQAWWIEPVLGNLRELPLMLAATVLTSFNDNAAITFLATLVPEFTDSLKHAVVAGAVTGGGLTVIANAPNPAGQALLKGYFPEGIEPGRLFLAALAPTVIVGALFLMLA